MKSLLELKVLTDEEIKEQKFAAHDLWLLKFKGQVIGPYHTDVLIDFSEENQALMETVLSCSIAEDNWTPFFQNIRFQRRTPKLIKAQTLIPSDFFTLLIDGEKKGPFSKDEINAKLDTGEILSSAEVSLDEGKSWFKAYEHHAFDRRTHKSSDDIPFSPKDNKIVHEKQEVVDSYEMPIVRGSEEFVKLAHIVRKDQEQKTPQKNIRKPEPSSKAEVIDFPVQKENKSQWKTYAIGSAVVAIIAVSFLTKISSDSKQNSVAERTGTQKRRVPASINNKKPKRKNTRRVSAPRKKISQAEIEKKRKQRRARRTRRKTASKVKRIESYHKNDTGSGDAYQKLLDQETETNLDTNRPEDKEFLNDLKREIAGNEEDDRDKKRERDEDQDMEEGDSYDERSEKPMLEKDPDEEPEEREEREEPEEEEEEY